MTCSCPDWSVPCKHLAAVFYLLAEAFDDDPFAILAWRGRERDDLLKALSALRNGPAAARDTAAADATAGSTAAGGAAAGGAVPLTECLDSFFAAPRPAPRRTPVPAPSDAVLDQLPAIGVTVRDISLVDLLRPAYRALGRGQPAMDDPEDPLR
nr:SWIM zinc finger family protein [Phytoactinopolyspora mesophila]